MLVLLLAATVVGIFAVFTDRGFARGWTLRERFFHVLGHLADDTGAWSASGGFRQFFTDFFGNANAFWTSALPNLDLVTWTTVTVTSYGCLVYADALTAPVADQGIIAVYFGGAFTTTAGNFTIQWSTNGLYQDDNS
jgi:hypothetical protein